MAETSTFALDPVRAFAEAKGFSERLAQGTKLFGEVKDEDVQIATTPKDEIWRQDKVTLYHYRPLAERKVQTPVLIAYGLVGRYTMVDLQEDRSLVRNLLEFRRRSLCRRLGQSEPRRPLRHARRLRHLSRRMRRCHRASARDRAHKPARHLRGRRLHHLLRGSASGKGAEYGVDDHADRLPCRQAVGPARVTASSMSGHARSRRRTSIG